MQLQPLQPLRRRAESTSEARRPPAVVTALSIYSHVSTYRSLQLELQLYSPSVKVFGDDRSPLAVFADHDHIGGQVILDSNCYHTGRLNISIEGAVTYTPVPMDSKETPSPLFDPASRKHVFFFSSTSITVSPNVETSSSRSAFREAFVRRRPSVPSISSSQVHSEKSHAFTFFLPESTRPGETLPSSYTAPKYSKYQGISYKIVATWEPADNYGSSSYLEVPIWIEPDSDFQSVDATVLNPESWLEMPLKSDRALPFRCAITLPTFVTFSRSSSVPYFVVFTTTPRSSTLAKEIAADASITVSLVRQITITEQAPLPPTPPQSPSGSEGSGSDTHRRLLKRVARSSPRLPRLRRVSDSTVDLQEKPLPSLPTQVAFFESCSLKHDISIGFPKRPRQLCDTTSHPTLDSFNLLPDGLHKSKIILDKDMLPCIDWAGVNVKYYLDVVVVIAHDDWRARIPIRVL